ncbi:MAG: hypothetical protein M3315_03180 [Actinomycetota bacterium]|jgi:Tfp pilus assembly protein FimT|nr:hypothetical protein [Actinomycetota bacterium]MDQ3921877.1 hypothetical protein [Actinomycetota bacterium]
MRRLLLVMAVALVMAAMLAIMAAPAFAGLHKGQSNTNRGFFENSFGDSRNNFTGCCNRGNSYARGDFLN